MSQQQEQYYLQMAQYKFSLIYWSRYATRIQTISRFIKISLAVISTISAATWANWNSTGYVCSILIIASQAVAVIYEYLPFPQRINELLKLTTALTPIYNNMEKEWFTVSNGELTDKEINQLLYDFIEKWRREDAKYFQDESLPVIKGVKLKADQEKNEYFRNRFGDYYGKK